ncbi:hypothetical protein AGMMS49545_21420 [Betaproteobacteria bacterium]|nr:hypothetical protein AGMMS49545_21420 [Betaproteobacteria bacterium]GHU48592.1 hypothetical protein AGMMS50289_25370 [Betaproteobacteria bacterium]
MKWALCLSNEGYEIDLEAFKAYRIVEDENATRHGCIRIVDESGEDYVYPAGRFEVLRLAAPAEKRLSQAVAAFAATA